MAEPLQRIGMEGPQLGAGAVELTRGEAQRQAVVLAVELPWRQRACELRSISSGLSTCRTSPPNHSEFSDSPLCSSQPEPKLPAMPPTPAKAARCQ